MALATAECYSIGVLEIDKSDILITGSFISIYFEELDIKKRKLGLDKF